MSNLDNKVNIRSREALAAFISEGNNVKYIFFWGHQKPKAGVSKTCFSQWYPMPFKINNIVYPTAEHFMMAEKARLFGDFAAEAKIISATHPGEAKNLGRRVKAFDEEVWIKNRFEIVVRSNMAKFEQNPDLKTFLLNTSQRILVEASPRDHIWGIGLAEDHPDAQNPSQWPGLNLLGFALMEARDRLAN
ncbi:MAG: NADAR family protein [Ardenticatenaceae bacterium]|nr:NADAR family protein [Ardenticatenaceae bacterium]